MTRFREAHEEPDKLDLAAAEYRLLADSLLNCISSERVQDKRLNGLVDHLYILAVQADRAASGNRPSTGQP